MIWDQCKTISFYFSSSVLHLWIHDVFDIGVSGKKVFLGEYGLNICLIFQSALYPFQVVDVSCGGDHTLALTSTGEVFSFGTSSNGQLGLGTRILETPQPQKIATGEHS